LTFSQSRITPSHGARLVILEVERNLARKRHPVQIWSTAEELCFCYTCTLRLFQVNRCLREGIFPERWKRQMLLLLTKPGKPAREPSSYRAIRLLDTIGKATRLCFGATTVKHNVQRCIEPRSTKEHLKFSVLFL